MGHLVWRSQYRSPPVARRASFVGSDTEGFFAGKINVRIKRHFATVCNFHAFTNLTSHCRCDPSNLDSKLRVAFWSSEFVSERDFCMFWNRFSIHDRTVSGLNVPLTWRTLYDLWKHCWVKSNTTSRQALPITVCPTFFGRQHQSGDTSSTVWSGWPHAGYSVQYCWPQKQIFPECQNTQQLGKMKIPH